MISALEKVLSSSGSVDMVPVTPVWFAVPQDHVDDAHGLRDIPIVKEGSVSLTERIAVLKEI
jgi:hypothetical protein